MQFQSMVIINWTFISSSKSL